MKEKIFDRIAIVGMHFREKEGIPAKSYVANMIPPVDLSLEREKENQFDFWALKAIYNGEHIGYVEAAGGASFISPLLDQGWTLDYCRVLDLEPRRNNLHPICQIRLVLDEANTEVDDFATEDTTN